MAGLLVGVEIGAAVVIATVGMLLATARSSVATIMEVTATVAAVRGVADQIIA